jgi:hypothetical protein
MFIAEGLLTIDEADLIIQTIEAERSKQRMSNDVGGEDQPDSKARGRLSERLTQKEMNNLLTERIEMMKKTDDGSVSDQYRVYQYITGELEKGTKFLRIMVQASAGTGKSFLLTTVYLWCLCKSIRVKACAPTGIAAANIDLSGTDVGANTIHSLFGLDGELTTKMDFAKVDDPKVAALLAMQVLLIDEFSMLDEPAWNTIGSLLSMIDHSRRPNDANATSLGNIHIILFGDFKQLPPATSKAPFIRLPSVRNEFEFSVLRQNRRVVKGDDSDARKAEIENFHKVLMDVSLGIASDRVRQFIIQAYVKGMLSCGVAENCDLEGSTTVFTKRRFRDRWNRTMVSNLEK